MLHNFAMRTISGRCHKWRLLSVSTAPYMTNIFPIKYEYTAKPNAPLTFMNNSVIHQEHVVNSFSHNGIKCISRSKIWHHFRGKPINGYEVDHCFCRGRVSKKCQISTCSIVIWCELWISNRHEEWIYHRLLVYYHFF